MLRTIRFRLFDKKNGRSLWLMVAALVVFFFLAVSSLVNDSPTMDEQNHLARGLAFLKTGDPRLSVEHPPLINSLSALPVLTLPNIRLPLDHPSWNQREGWYAFADQLLWVYNHDVNRMIFLARVPIVFLTIGLALVGFHFGRELWGQRAGLVAFVLLLFDPNIVAHGRYSTTDVGGTLFISLAAWLLWRAWKQIGWRLPSVLWAGLGLGLAFGSKFTSLVFVPIFAILALLPLYYEEWSLRHSLRRLGQLVLAGLISLPIVWMSYGFQWDNFTFLTAPFSGLNRLSGPMPTFWAGIEQILRISSGGRPTFLLGQFSTDGFVAYFPIAFLVKTPLPILFLVGLAGILVARQSTRKRALFLLIPPVLYFLLSMQSALNIGYRHLLPVLPFLYIFIGGLTNLPTRITKYKLGTSHLLILMSALVLLVNLFIYPHYLSYFNIAAGGPKNGGNILVDSNIDWGQDLLRLQDWMVENEVEQVNLSWFGTADPDYYGIDYNPLPGLPRHFDLWWNVPFNTSQPEPGIYAISISNLWEIPLEEKTTFAWFREREPYDRVGYSILIYRVSRNDVVQR